MPPIDTLYNIVLSALTADAILTDLNNIVDMAHVADNARRHVGAHRRWNAIQWFLQPDRPRPSAASFAHQSLRGMQACVFYMRVHYNLP